MDEVFRAINDPSRRLLLDSLYVDDGQTLGELCHHLPEMTRFGVMNHLRVLEEAGLLTTRKVGRAKHHYLNPVPIRIIHDRWISKYAEPVIGRMAGVKAQLEQGGGTPMAAPVHVYQVYIGAPQQAVWNAIVDGDQTVQYFYGTRVESDWDPGSLLRYTDKDGKVVADGKVIEIDPPNRVEMEFVAHWDPELEAEGPVVEVWLVEPTGDSSAKLTIELYGVSTDSKTYREFTQGFPYIVSGMKTLLETGQPLKVG